VARYATHHKEATRQRIVHTAGRRLKSAGLAGSGVATLMADAGLANGAFYVHFTSKNDLIATVVGEELGTQQEAAAALVVDEDGLPRLVRSYLSAEHRDHIGDGCPSAALIEEIARSGDRVRDAYTLGIISFVDPDRRTPRPGRPAHAAGQVIAAFAGMVGTLQMARTIADRQLSDALLAQGIDGALILLGVAEHRSQSGSSDPEAHASASQGDHS
jgi:TetR/AcrR family transcriptional regulator, transcriptional repressor for nem operon